ncbi:MAG: ParB/RepB/Spo0J family partition protein [Syntrophaceae bacterium]|nr:ParB/RepB/Spo0J family partition protein [Syntrophaceae bacterium]
MDTIRHDLIFPNPDQPRKVFHPGKLEELAQSIKVSGLMEPIVVVKRGDRFMIVAGERRWRACAIAGLEEVPARIIEADEQKVAELSLLENLQREDLNIIEEAMAYQGLINMGLTQEEIAAKMGIKQSWRIQERLNLLKLAPVFQDYVVKGILTPSQAQEMSRLSEDKQGLVFDRISAGKAETYNELRSLVNAMLCVTEQFSFLPEPTPKQREVNNKYDRLIESIVNFINRSFDREDLSVLSAVLTPAARENIDRIDLIIWHLNKIKRALLQADSTREVIQQTTLSTIQ